MQTDLLLLLTSKLVDLFFKGFLYDWMSVPNTRDSSPTSGIDDLPSIFKRDVDPLSANSHRRLPWCTMQNPSGRRSGHRHDHD